MLSGNESGGRPKPNEGNARLDDVTALFKGAFPEFYDRYIVPMIFTSYAMLLADRAKDLALGRVQEIAAGTGIVT